MNNQMIANASPAINCKRQIVLKNIVTENFKFDAALEIKEAIEALKNQAKQLSDVIKHQKEKGHDVSQLDTEFKKAIVQGKLLEQRLEELKNVKNGELYTSGTFEAYSPLKVGDNIHDKLGNVEVICKDNVVLEINTASLQKKNSKN
jgi:hypothetical protein